MSDFNKPKRPYNSTRRQAQARQTHQQIAGAARRLFTERGYTGATIEAIAHAAEVAPETIYATFGNKRKILAYLMNIAVGGDEEPIGLLDRPEAQATMGESDQRRQLSLFAHSITSILERVAPIFAIMRAAAKTEPEIADLLERILQERWQNLGTFVQHVAANGSLREGLLMPQAVDTVWAITSPEVFTLLTVDRGWSKEQYIDWLATSLIRLLLP
jgi:AcrR family transcriptional regulator